MVCHRESFYLQTFGLIVVFIPNCNNFVLKQLPPTNRHNAQFRWSQATNSTALVHSIKKTKLQDGDRGTAINCNLTKTSSSGGINFWKVKIHWFRTWSLCSGIHPLRTCNLYPGYIRTAHHTKFWLKIQISPRSISRLWFLHLIFDYFTITISQSQQCSLWPLITFYTELRHWFTFPANLSFLH